MTEYQGRPPAQRSPASSAAPQRSVGERARSGRSTGILLISALVMATVATVLAGIALARQPAPTTQGAATTSRSTSEPSAAAAEVKAAKARACAAWTTASAAIKDARHPFIEAPPNWNDPITMNALAQAQAGALTQIEYLRQQLRPATPKEVAEAIRDYIAAVIETVAADGQHQPAAVANAAAERGTAAAATIRTVCGG